MAAQVHYSWHTAKGIVMLWTQEILKKSRYLRSPRQPFLVGIFMNEVENSGLRAILVASE